MSTKENLKNIINKVKQKLLIYPVDSNFVKLKNFKQLNRDAEESLEKIKQYEKTAKLDVEDILNFVKYK
jgi:DhnA family fructose-bisphosphate aldolase class Ia